MLQIQNNDNNNTHVWKNYVVSVAAIEEQLAVEKVRENLGKTKEIPFPVNVTERFWLWFSSESERGEGETLIKTIVNWDSNMDAKDILGLPKNSFPALEKKSRPHKESQRKPDGISREVLTTIIHIFSVWETFISELKSIQFNWICICRCMRLLVECHLLCHPLMLLNWKKDLPLTKRFFFFFLPLIVFICLFILWSFLFRSLGNGFLSRILLVKTIFNFTIG